MAKKESTFLDVVNFISDNVDDTASSLPEYLQGTRNDFLTMVEDNIAEIPQIKDILSEVNILVASYYLAALTMHLGSPEASVRKDLDKFAVERSPLKTAIKFGLALGAAYLAGKSGAALAKRVLGLEGMTGTLGAPGDYSKRLMFESMKPLTQDDIDKAFRDLDSREEKLRKREDKLRSDHASMRNTADRMRNASEADRIREREENLGRRDDSLRRKADGIRNASDRLRNDRESARLEEERKKLDEERAALESQIEAQGSVTVGKGDLAKMLHEGGSLASGKTFDLVIERNGNKMPLTIDVSLAVLVAESEAVKVILGVGDYKYSFQARKLEANAGTKKWVRDIVFSRDLIDAMRQNRYKDKSGYYKSVINTRNRNMLSGMFGNLSVNNASSAFVISQETVDAMEPVLGNSLDDFDTRQRLFENTLTMIIAVVDRQWESVTFYHRGLRRYSEINLRDLSKGGKGNNLDVSEVIRAYQAGSSPSMR